jgi:pimeloyl-ACP methyl ester carboxylesterase
MADDIATVSNRARKLPIVVVPGTMGSRLMDPANDEIVWNPTGFPVPPLGGVELGTFAAKLARLEQVSAPLVGDTHVFAREFMERPVSHIRHFHSVIRAFYGGLALKLERDLKKLLAPKGLFPVVYCAGYDFRVNNATSATTLQKVVDEARAECDGEQVIIIAHSMGGLVTRSYCKNLGGEANVKRVFLLASPTHGAPDAYFTLRNGMEGGLLRTLIFGDIFKGTDSRNFARRMPSVYQLLPTTLYCKIDSNWLRFEPAKTGIGEFPPHQPIPALQFSDNSNSALLFLDLYAGLRGDLEFRELSGRLFGEASRFDASLTLPNGKAYFHPNTTVVFTADMETVTRGEVAFKEQTISGATTTVVSFAKAEKLAAGDKTVPTISADPDRTDPQPVLRKQVSGIEHQKIPSTESVMQFLVDQIAAAP